jgi:catechol 2,3-dioxygenase-like lactoylglutathione lyase family enzyme
MTIQRMDNVLIVVDDLEAAKSFFIELGLELDKFHSPNAIRFGPVDAPVNALGIRRIMFAVEDIDAVVALARPRGRDDRRGGAVRGHVSAWLHPRA